MLTEVAPTLSSAAATGSGAARGLGLPRPKRRDYIYLTHGQVLALACEAGRGRLLILLLAYTGLRWSEATALRVCDIDFDRRRVAGMTDAAKMRPDDAYDEIASEGSAH